LGPTAVGKTDLAIRLAEYYHTEIISADSRQIYRELEIGTAKPTTEELSRVRHHFVNTKSVTEEYDAGTFGREARDRISELFKTREAVVMCGGSGLYVKAVLEGFDDLPDVPAKVREDIVEEYRERGLEWLQQEIAANDPDYYEAVDRQNPQRLMRALEIIRTTGKPFTEFRKNEKTSLPFAVLKIGLERERKELYQRIDDRMEDMIEKGLFREAEKFFTLRHRHALQTVGYQEVFEFLEGVCNRDEAVRLMKRNSRRYAKRQLTWFRRDPEIQWFHPDDWNGILEKTMKFVE
jgi:tRNA dimethylallyltransferase